MSSQSKDAARIAEVAKQASEIAAVVPEHLQEAAFNRAFDELSGGKSSVGAPKSSKATKGRSGRAPENRDGDVDPVAVLVASLSRTDHPEITDVARSLDRALHLLRVANRDFGIDGLGASQIAKVLNDKFRQPIKPQTLGEALNGAGRFVDRIPQPDGSVIFRLMDPGEKHLDALAASHEQPGATRQRKGKQEQRSPKKAARQVAKRPARRPSKNPSVAPKSEPSSRKRRAGQGPKSLVEDLIREDFFTEPKTIGEIQGRLRHKKSVKLKATDLSPALVRLLRENSLDRERNDSKQYEYVVPAP
ncbi:MAG TPA: hypothetical protein VHT25_00665 [Solirubrobacteraceae bacterium]|nr:hypothetical protein [Solirubrobacteraceae bacterium]